MSGAAQQTLLILDATGDLAARLLLPGLGALLARGGGKDLLLIGSGRHDWDDNRWRKRVADSFAAVGARGRQVDAVVKGMRYLKADVTTEGDLRRLLDACQGHLVIFFASPPSVTMRACRVLCGIGLPEDTRLVLEKPFGTDAASAVALNDLLARLVPEDQVHRVDHCLGMATVLNIVGLRFANRMLESVLNADHVQTKGVHQNGSTSRQHPAGAVVTWAGSPSWSIRCTSKRWREKSSPAYNMATGPPHGRFPDDNSDVPPGRSLQGLLKLGRVRPCH